MRLSGPRSLAALAPALAIALAAQPQASPSISTVFQLSDSPTWFENLAIRSSGEILATRVDVPELWAVDPFTKSGSRLLSVPEVTALLGITEVYPDVFAFVGTNFSIATGIQPNSSQIWELDLRGRSPVSRLAAKLPQAGLLNGADTWDSSSILVADSTLAQILLVDINTGQSAVAISDPTMTVPPNSTHPIGPNGVKVFRSARDRTTYVYYTSMAQALFCRVPVNAQTAAPMGPVQIIASGFTMDDFTLLEDGSALVAANTDNTIVKVTLDGTVTTVAGSAGSLDLATATACRFGRTARDSRVLYVTTTGGATQPVNGTFTRPANIAAVDFAACGW
jgi:hypothetical protein